MFPQICYFGCSIERDFLEVKRKRKGIELSKLNWFRSALVTQFNLQYCCKILFLSQLTLQQQQQHIRDILIVFFDRRRTSNAVHCSYALLDTKEPFMP